MANLVSLYREGNVNRMLKFIESEVLKACGCYIGQRADSETIRRLQEERMRITTNARMQYGVSPLLNVNAVITIDDGTRSVRV